MHETPGALQALPSRPKKKVNRKDPAKRREQNRRSQKLYREKQKQRIEELERCAANAAVAGGACGAGIANFQTGALDLDLTSGSEFGLDVIDLPYQQSSFAQSPYSVPACSDLGPHAPSPDYQQWLNDSFACFSADSTTFSCMPGFHQPGCPVLLMPAISLKPRPSLLPDPLINNLLFNPQCVFMALKENCLHLGISNNDFCTDLGMSPFFRPEFESASESDSKALLSLSRQSYTNVKFDLRPVEGQLVINHHPYIDVIPFRDLRRNLLRMLDEIDEDDFFRDCLESWTCWGPSAGIPSGRPWDPRSWEASEAFLGKWSHVIGGDEGELARQSRWWQSIRGDRITEIL
ncbi:hypothetical protein B0I35DRAFT_473796 [Stachybotrys elegans]|uniref:BZIP domain-containing protein n=1 Tax=Stachybotrys elegans TaxID=80388 RepID=A0A8K0T2V0_9HYPO|nr:hypothetical protein B0I35DRAFT_473796 [Stachybotrys elegans]